MSFNLYNKAFGDMLKSLLPNSFMVQDPLSIEQASKGTDKPGFPLITFYPIETALIPEYTNRATSLHNTELVKIDTLKAYGVKYLPFRVAWQVDFYDPDLDTVDEMIREFLFYIEAKPKLFVTIPYGLNEQTGCNLRVEPDIQDNSDLTDFKQRGKVYRKTLTVFTDEAFLFNVKVTPNKAILQIDINDGGETFTIEAGVGGNDSV